MLTKFVLWLSRWSAEFGAPRNGSPELNVMLAEYIYSESPEVVGVKSKIEGFQYMFVSTPTLCALPFVISIF